MANYCYKVMFGTLVLGLIAFLIVNVRQHVLAQGQYKQVRSITGPVRGERRLSLFDQRQYYAFRGIPYAEKPIGPDRFKAPRPVRPWKTVRNCYEHSNVCIQQTADRQIIGDEDCLYLNVYTSDVEPPEDKRRAVMVWIPGENWFSGSGDVDFQGPDFLVEEDIVVVTLNYRLGMFGFFATETTDFSGNQGLKDQQLALEWVFENIHLFGGDTKRITVFGRGAGSVSTFLHMMAKRSEPLFKRTIQMSTTFEERFMFKPAVPPKMIGIVQDYLRKQSRKHRTSKDVIDELMDMNAKDITANFPYEWNPFVGPVLERQDAEHAFLSEQTWLKPNWTTTKDILAGYTSAEAIAIPSYFDVYKRNQTLPIFDTNLSPVRSEAYQSAMAEIRDRYFANATADRSKLVRLMTDLYQIYPIDKKIRHLAARSKGSVYYYSFDLDTQFNYNKRWLHGETEIVGASHGDIQCYVFRCEAVPDMYANVTIDSLPYNQIKTITRLYANFAKSGVPLLAWLPVTKNVVNVLNITQKELAPAIDPFREGRSFWDGIMEREEGRIL